MLDEPTDATQPAAPRRRRSASRPSGPPAPVAAEPTAVSTVAAAQAASTSAGTEEPTTKATRRTRRKADDVTATAAVPAAESAEAPAKQTRSRSRAAAAAVEPTNPAEPGATGTAAPTPAEETAPKVRKATSRKSAAPAPEPAPPLPVDDVPGTVTTSDSTPRTRRRTPRAATSPRPRPDTLAGDPAVAAPPVDDPLGAAIASLDAATPPAEPASGPASDDAADPIGAALAALDEKPAARRRRSSRREAGAPVPPPSLDEIAATIAAAEPTEPADPTETDPAEAAETDPAEAAEADPAEAAETESSEAGEEGDDGEATAAEVVDETAGPEAVEVESSPDSADETDDESEGPRRRRRRRGGRRRRRGGDAETDDETPSDASDQEPDDAAAGPEAEADGDSDGEGEPEEGGRRRRRRRRRRGEDATASDDDPSDVVVKVREPRSRRRGGAASDEVTGIEGSTRMEAKRLRRREGRAAGRRRAPILSEAEFLARREAVERTMLIRQQEGYSQIAVLEDGVLVEHYVDRASATSLIGNVYLGKVQNVLPSMEAAFIDIGRGRNAVLYAGEVDWDSFGADGAARKVEKVFKSGQAVLVQVTKDPVGAKGARLTSHISIPGRYLVYAPGGNLSGISRKLPEQERNRLKSILGDLVPDEASVIIRTAAEGASADELVRDVNRLKAQWEVIEKKVKQGSAPQLLYGEPDLTVRIVRDLFTEDFSRLVVDGNGSTDDAYETVNAYVSHVAPHLADRLVKWDREGQGDLFAGHRIDEQIAKALERKVFLPSGGSLIIDRTEAMTVIDVNTGKFTGSGGNLEATVTSNNLEAAEEIVRQLRLRDIGGIIVIDFIDMVLPSNRELLLRRLVECLGRDRTRHQVAEVTSLGLVQMTRKKIGTGLAEAFTEPCESCSGRGYHRHDEPVASQAPADGGDRGGRGRGRRG